LRVAEREGLRPLERKSVNIPYFWYRSAVFALAALALFPLPGTSQQPENPAPKASPSTPPPTAQSGPEAASPLPLTLQDALARARKNSVEFQAVATDAAIATEDRKQIRDSLLPTASYNNEVLYTQGNNAGSVRYIANNAVHEYISQGNVHEAIDLAAVANYKRATAASAIAKARAEIASRGLVVTVVQSYFRVAAAQSKMDIAQRGASQGEDFFKLTQALEKGGEVAHSDVIRAELQMQDRRRQLRESQLELLNAKLDLAVLIFPDFNENFEISDDLHASVPLPTIEEVQQQGARDNPELRAALAGVQEAGHGVADARAGYFPSLTLDYFYGIDSAQFATNSVIDNQKIHNLGSSASATLNIPVWNWGTTQSRVKQAELRRTQAQRELSLAQRKLLAEMRSLYAEAETALNELSGLQRSADLASEGLRLATLRYKGGETTVIEVVDAQNSFAQANTSYQDGAVRYRVALANLQTLTGTLTTP
jgi:outer membrane protein TolC